VASALKWAFADFDDLGVAADRQTLSLEDFAKVMELLKSTPDSVLHFLEGAGRRGRNAAVDGPGNWGCQTEGVSECLMM
jgi:hypothetical protein